MTVILSETTRSHKPLTSLSETELALDLASLEEKFFAATGAVMSKYFRPRAVFLTAKACCV